MTILYAQNLVRFISVMKSDGFLKHRPMTTSKKENFHLLYAIIICRKTYQIIAISLLSRHFRDVIYDQEFDQIK